MKCMYNKKDRKKAYVKDIYSIAMLIYSIDEDGPRNEGNEVEEILKEVRGSSSLACAGW